MEHQDQNNTGLRDGHAESGGEDEGDFESDSEGTTALAMRRQEASDEGEDDQELLNSIERRPSFSDEDLEDEGAPPPDDEEEEDEEEDEDEEYEHEIDSRIPMSSIEDEGDCQVPEHHTQAAESSRGVKAKAGDGRKGDGGSKEPGTEERKDAEPFVVPTAGAFYMHDDRFQYSNEVRPRRTAGGRKLWEAKDAKPWVHDRFEELNLQEESYHGQGSQGGGRFRGQGRGRGRMRGRGRGRTEYVKGRDSEERFLEESSSVSSRRRSGRGRVLRKAKMDEYDEEKSHLARQRILASQSFERTVNRSASTQKPAAPLQPTIKTQDSSASKKPVAGSILSSASPPFYPTGALSQSTTGHATSSSRHSQVADNKMPERGAQMVQARVDSPSTSQKEKGPATSNPSPMRKRFSAPTNSMLPRQTSSTLPNSNYEPEPGGSVRNSNSFPLQMLRTGSGSMVQQKPGQALHSAMSQQQGRVMSLAQSMQTEQLQQIPQSSKQGQSIQRQALQSQTAGFIVSSSNKSMVDVKGGPMSLANTITSGGNARSGQATTFQAGRGSLVYAASSSSGLTNGLCSVVQLTGQSQGGLGVPAVGVALPGYSNQPQFGFGNSEVTWIPILAGGGSSLSSQYIAVDGGSPAVYYAQPTSQPAALAATGRESKPASSGAFKPPTNAGLNNDELGQRQSKPRRYSEMNFGQ